MNFGHIDFRYLKAFITTARQLSFSKAAKEMGVAQSAISRQIKLLEESLGQQLIVRSSQKVILTQIGKDFYKELTEFEQKITELFHPHSHRTIRIGILHGFLETWFNDVIVEYSKNFSHQLVIEVNSLQKLKENLQTGTYDLIFTSENIQNDLVSSVKLFEEKMVLISKSLFEPGKAHLYPWIAYSNQDHLFQLYSKRSNQLIIVNSITAMIKLVSKGLGIAIVPEHTIENKKNLNIYDLKNISKQHIYLSSLNLQKSPDYLKNILEIIKSKL